MSLQDLTNISIPIHKSQEFKSYIPDLKSLVCYCQGDKELISILTEAISEVFQENQALQRREKELIYLLGKSISQQQELDSAINSVLKGNSV